MTHTRIRDNKLDTNCKLGICDEECNLVFSLLCLRVVELSMTTSTPPSDVKHSRSYDVKVHEKVATQLAGGSLMF